MLRPYAYSDMLVDVETLSSRSDAAIIMLGAQLFNADTLEVAPRAFARCLHWPKDLAGGEGHVDPSTLVWWIQQPDAARGALFSEAPVSLKAALQEFDDGFRFRELAGVRRLWAYPATFDLPIVAAAADRVGVAWPWLPFAWRCAKTVHKLFGVPQDVVTPEIEHHAGHDARAHVLTLVNTLRRLRSESETR